MASIQSPGMGLRLYDEHAAKAARLVEHFRGLDTGITPSNALGALKRAAPYMGIPLRVVSVIDLLFAWTKAQDWHGGRIPTVWPSNELLAQKLGVTVRQVQKLLKQAQAYGLVGFIDSPNGHRGGRRGADGHIKWAYGIVLAPIGTRYRELADRAARGAREDEELYVLRKRLASARRKIRTLAQTALDATLVGTTAQDDMTLAQMATSQMRSVRDIGLLTACVKGIEDRAAVLEAEVRAMLLTTVEQTNSPESSCSGASEAIHSTTTNHLQSAKADTCRGLAKGSSCGNDALPYQERTEVEADLERHGIGPSFILEAAPDLCPDYLSGQPTWGVLVATAERLAGQSGIGSHAFREACRVMGHRGAAASIIATLQKHRRGEVHRPGAYLRGMSAKAERGELNLGRTLHGLKEAGHAQAMRGMADGTEPAPFRSLISRVIGSAVA